MEKDRVRDFFDTGAAAFDSIYSGGKSRFAAWLDRVFRWDMRARFDETMRVCADARGLHILDAGCGSGRYAVALAKRGARVTGVDCAPEMIRLSKEYAAGEGVAERCRFVEGDCLSVGLPADFDIVIAIGFFDYMPDSAAYLERFKVLCRGRLIATFPRFWTWRAPVRKLRLALSGCPVYFFTRRRVIALLRRSGWRPLEVKRVGKLHFVVARANGQ